MKERKKEREKERARERWNERKSEFPIEFNIKLVDIKRFASLLLNHFQSLLPSCIKRFTTKGEQTLSHFREKLLRADVSKYRPEVYKSEKSKILKKNSQSSTR